MHAELRFINGPLGGQSVELPQEKNVLLGRAGSCEITVKAAGISRSHCRVDHDGRDYHLTDLGSVNGTFVNNERTPRHVLQDGDAVRIGQVEALFLWEETAILETDDETQTLPIGLVARRRVARCDQCAAPTDLAHLGTEGGAKDGPTYCKRCQEVGPVLGREIAQYKVDSKIAHGGMGAVFKGRALSNKRPVAIKILSSELSADPESIRRFLRGAGTALTLDHDHIVRVYDVGESRGLYYIAMEYVDGPTVLDAMTTGKLGEVRKVLRIGIQVTQALMHAHKKRIVHRDIKPSNIMLTRKDVSKLTDLGLMKCLDEAGVSGITESDVAMGTLDYMAPEQIDDARSVDHRGDLYSLGATMFHLLTERTVFSSRNVIEKMKKIRYETPVSAAELNEKVPESLSEAIQRMLAKSPDERYQTSQELLRALVGIRQELIEQA